MKRKNIGLVTGYSAITGATLPNKSINESNPIRKTKKTPERIGGKGSEVRTPFIMGKVRD
jgi:hypothetical protein